LQTFLLQMLQPPPHQDRVWAALWSLIAPKSSSGRLRWAQRDRFPFKPTLVALTPQLIELTRPVDAHLEHVEFPALLQRLSPILILHIFASAVLERRLIFLAEELR